MDEDESFNEFYAKLKDIVNLAFNLGEQILVPKIVRKILKSLPERLYAKITIIEESNDLDSIHLIELIGNMQTYELARVGKDGKGKNMGLKTKNDDNDKSSDDEDTKLKSYFTRKFKKFIKNANVKAGDKNANSLHSLNSSPKTKARENSRMLVKAIVFLLDQSAMGVKDLDT